MGGADTERVARRIYEDFHDKPSRRRVKFDFGWPKVFQEVGRAEAQMYRSNKWKKNPREFEDYKHIAESEQRCYVVPNVLVDDKTREPLKTYGDLVEFEDLPTHITILAALIGIQVRFYDSRKRLPRGDKNLKELFLPQGMLGGARFVDSGEAFLVVYTKNAGVVMIITGEELDIEKDGIVG